MTEWGLLAIYGIPAAAIVCFGLGIHWERLKGEPRDKAPKMQTHGIMFLEERKRRMKSCGR